MGTLVAGRKWRIGEREREEKRREEKRLRFDDDLDWERSQSVLRLLVVVDRLSSMVVGARPGGGGQGKEGRKELLAVFLG